MEENFAAASSGRRLEEGDGPSTCNRFSPASETGGDCFRDAVRNFKREVVRAALRRNGYNKQQTARELRISRPYLFRLMRRLEIDMNPSAADAAGAAGGRR